MSANEETVTHYITHNSAEKKQTKQDSEVLILVVMSTLAEHPDFETYFKPGLTSLYNSISKKNTKKDKQ
tara:strand:- start:24 stop:230 length:207 start_codon:yes stop_codon:yes gene_type:complete